MIHIALEQTILKGVYVNDKYFNVCRGVGYGIS